MYKLFFHIFDFNGFPTTITCESSSGFLMFNTYNYEILAYCLMDNHVHLLLKTEVQPPWRFIAWVHSIYARYFNKKYNYVGALFQGRYSADIIEDDTYMLET